MSRAVAKIRVHKNGGAANLWYIGSLRDERLNDTERQPGGELSAPSARDEQLTEIREGAAGRGGNDDLVWGWNVPWFVADDGHGVWETEEGRALLDSKSLSLAAHHMGLGPAPRSAEKLSVEEKRENLVAHLSALAELEERLGGLSHFRIILTVGLEVSIRDLKGMSNAFLRENFPLCPAFITIHDDTEHRHAHIYVHARQLDNLRVNLGQNYFRLDESWMRVCAEHLGDHEIYRVHMELKDKTIEWKVRAEKAKEAKEPLPPKPDRWGDHHDTLLIFRPFDDRWSGRLQAQTRVAETKVMWLEATKAKTEEVTAAREQARVLRERLDTAVERRNRSKRESKRGMPAEVITVSEALSLKGYERDIRKAEERTEKVSKEPVAPGPTVTQSVLSFDGPADIRGGQLGFDFEVPAARVKADAEPRIRWNEKQSASATENTKRAEPTREAVATERTAAPRSAEPAHSAAQRLPEDEVGRLLVAYELARGRAVMLRAEEKDFAAIAHHWVAPAQGLTLAQVEWQIADGIAQKQNVERLYAVRECVRDEIIAERIDLPLRRQKAEDEVIALEQRVRMEAGERKRLGIEMPDTDPTPDELREMTHDAVSARAPQQLRRVYEIERGQVLRSAKLTGDAEPIRRLAEKYAGVELMAEVRADRSQKRLSVAARDPEKTVLPAKDEIGRDLALTLEQAGSQKGVTALFKKLVEGKAGRRLREQLVEAKDAHLGYLRADSSGSAAFHETAQEIARECRDRGRQFGHDTYAVPALSREEIAEVRDDARFLTDVRRERWFAAATQSQHMMDERDAATAPARHGYASHSQPEPPDPAREERIQKQLEEARARQQGMTRIPRKIIVNQERTETRIGRDRDEQARTRPKGGGGRSR